ncbi:MAG: hypothetical protein NC311_14270 [Muribaculaceae bacterium]|nr:hypothetical protein [Muribaculaceae bacterium]
MEQETTLAQSIRVAADRASLDAACKRLLSEKILLAWIMKSCLEEYKDSTVEEIAQRYIDGDPVIDAWAMQPDEMAPTRIQSIGQEDTSLNEQTITYDIRFHAIAPSTGEMIRLIINIETQNKFRDGYPLLKRAIYYCSRLISSQYGTEFTHSQYGKIKKVYSIWLCADPPKAYRNTITRYRMTEENMVGLVKEPVQDYDLLTVVLLCLGGPEDENYNGILKLLDVLLSKEIHFREKQQILQEDFDLAMTEQMEQEVLNVCNLSQGVWERGMEKGREEGRAEGAFQNMLASIQNLMNNVGWSVEQAMSALNIPEAERPKYRKLLQRQ